MRLSPVSNQKQRTNFTAKFEAPIECIYQLLSPTNTAATQKKIAMALEKIKNTRLDEVLELKSQTYGSGFDSYVKYTAFNKTKGEQVAEKDSVGWVNFFTHAADRFAEGYDNLSKLIADVTSK